MFGKDSKSLLIGELSENKVSKMLKIEFFKCFISPPGLKPNSWEIKRPDTCTLISVLKMRNKIKWNEIK